MDWSKWLKQNEIIIYIIIACIAGGIWAFAELADEVFEGETHVIDEKILLLMRTDDVSDPIGPLWVEEFFRDVTAWGGIATLTLISAFAVGYLLLLKKHKMAVFIVVAVLGGLLVSSTLKRSFDRPRPDLVPHGSQVYTASFPSGHSMLSAVTFLTLGALLARVQSKFKLKIYLISVSILITILIGISRVYLGVHWPTDVLAGWTAGTIWALICWCVAIFLQNRGNVESSEDETQSLEQINYLK